MKESTPICEDHPLVLYLEILDLFSRLPHSERCAFLAGIHYHDPRQPIRKWRNHSLRSVKVRVIG